MSDAIITPLMTGHPAGRGRLGPGRLPDDSGEVSESEAYRLRRGLSMATRPDGGELSEESCAAIIRAVRDPSAEAWSASQGTVIHPSGCTLWGAVVAHSDYPVTVVAAGDEWPELPTRTQILAGLCTGARMGALR